MVNRTNTLYYFPKGYDAREEQKELLNWWDEVRQNNIKCKVVDAPTGVGKSFAAYAVAEREAQAGRKVSIVTGSNLLLDQYIKSFPHIPFLKGADHYDSLCSPGNSCGNMRNMYQAMGIKHRDACPDCPYLRARGQCYDSDIALFNSMSYYYFPKWERIDGKVVKPVTDLVILDEFQMLASMLNMMFELIIWEDDIAIPYGVSASNIGVVELLNKRCKAITKLIKSLHGNADVKRIVFLCKHYEVIKNVIEMLQEYPDLFIVEETEKQRRGHKLRCLHIRAVKPLPAVLKHFFAAKEVLLMSATALDVDVRELGFKKFDKKAVGTPIHVSRRLIYVENIAKNTFALQKVAIPKIIERIEEICNKFHPNERGVILTTYRMAAEMQKTLTDPRFVYHDHDSKKGVISNFLEGSANNTVAILSGSFEGLDLKDELTRFTILPIIPLPNFVDAVVKKRIELDNLQPVREHWYEMQAMKLIIQGTGRGTRHEKDMCTNYILDSKFMGIYAKVKNYLPKYFIDGLVWSKR